MLEQLRGIVQKVNAAKDLQSALNIIVHRVREALSTQVCSVYLLDTDINSHVLMASEGLKEEAIKIHTSLNNLNPARADELDEIINCKTNCKK